MTDSAADTMAAPQAVLIKRAAHRPSGYRPEFALLAENLTLLGLDRPRLAEALGVSHQTIDRWIATQSEFREAILRAREPADGNIVRALYQRAQGFVARQQRPMILKNPDGSQRVEIVEYLERFPPDTLATVFWLKNRQPQHWRDKQDIDMSISGTIGRLPDEDRTGKALAALQAMLQGKKPKPTADNPPLIEGKAEPIKGTD